MRTLEEKLKDRETIFERKKVPKYLKGIDLYDFEGPVVDTIKFLQNLIEDTKKDNLEIHIDHSYGELDFTLFFLVDEDEESYQYRLKKALDYVRRKHNEEVKKSDPYRKTKIEEAINLRNEIAEKNKKLAILEQQI